MSTGRWATFLIGSGTVLLGFAGAALIHPTFAIMMAPGFFLITGAAMSEGECHE